MKNQLVYIYVAKTYIKFIYLNIPYVLTFDISYIYPIGVIMSRAQIEGVWEHAYEVQYYW